MSLSKLVLGGAAVAGLGYSLFKGVSRKVARENLKRALTTKSAAATKTRYPITPKNPIVDDYHGTKVTDNYRWLEDPDSDETKVWVREQNAVTDSYFAERRNLRVAIGCRLKEIFNFERLGVPFQRKSRVFFYKNDGVQNQSVLYWYDETEQKSTAAVDVKSADGGEREAPKTGVKTLIDPNLLSKDGTAALGSVQVSDSGEFIAYGVARSGSDWNTIYIKRVSDGFEFKEVIEWVKFSSISWTADDSGFFYSRYAAPSEAGSKSAGTETESVVFQKLYYHAIGTPQSADRLIWSNPENPKWMTSGSVTDDGLYLLLYITESCDPVNRLFYVLISDLKLKDANVAPDAHRSKVVKLIDNFDAEYGVITNIASQLIVKTNLKAPKGKIISIDLDKPDAANWREIVATNDDVLDSAQCVDRTLLVCSYTRHACEVPKIFDLATAKEVTSVKFTLPGPCSIGIAGNYHGSDVFYKVTAQLYPGTIYRLNVRTGKCTIWGEIKVKGFDASLFETTQVFYPSKDGTKIPMFITSRKDTKKTGANPTLLYGYGGFNISLPPAFSVSVLLWVQHFDGVYASANIRGGGEYGEDWHKAGSILNKQNVFDDFHAGAEYLIAQKWTSSANIAINGASNGGLLVAACINQRPELYGAAVAQVGVLDMLRFHKWTIGHAWCSDYGCADDNKDQFDALYKYSPVHNCVKKPYPATMIMTADHDDRVVPQHSFKYAAALQDAVGEADYQTKPVIIRIETKAGHGAGKPLAKTIEELSDYYSFVASNVGAYWHL